MVRISKTFIRSSLIYTIAGMLPVASAILLLPFYLGGLSVSNYGALAIYLSSSLLVQVLTTYSFDTSLYLHFHEFKHEPRKLASFISSAYVLMIFIGAGVCIVTIVLGSWAVSKFFPDGSVEFFPYGIVAAMTGVFQAFFKVHSNLLQSREQPTMFFWSNLLSFALIASLTIIGLQVYPDSMIGPVGGRLVAAVVSGIWVLGRIFSEFGIHFNYRLLRESFHYNFYAFIYQIQQWVINYFDRFVMLFYLPVSSVGVYDFGIKCLLVIEFVSNGLHSTFYPRVVSAVASQRVKGGTPEINRYYHGFISVMMVMTCLCILVFPWLIGMINVWFNKAEYAQVIQYLPFMAIFYILRSVRLFFSIPYGALKYTKPLPVIYLIISVVKIGAMVLLIRRFEIYGVIFSSLLGAVVEIVLLWYESKDRFSFRFNIYKVVLVPVILFIVIAGTESIIGKTYPAIFHTMYLVVCLALLIWVYRREVRLIDPFRFIK